MPTHMHTVTERDPLPPDNSIIHTLKSTHTFPTSPLPSSTQMCLFQLLYRQYCTSKGACLSIQVNIFLCLSYFLPEVFYAFSCFIFKINTAPSWFPHISYLLHPVSISFPLIHEILSPSLDISAYTHSPTQRPKNIYQHNISAGIAVMQLLICGES